MPRSPRAKFMHVARESLICTNTGSSWLCAPCLVCFHALGTHSKPAKVCRAGAVPGVGTVVRTLNGILSSLSNWGWGVGVVRVIVLL